MAAALVVAFLSTLAYAVEPQKSVDIYAWPMSDDRSQMLARAFYNTTHAHIVGYAPPKIPPGDDLVRVCFGHPSGAWSGVSTAASNVMPGKHKKIQLHLNLEGELYHLGFKASDMGSSSTTGTTDGEFSVEIVPMKRGPTPHLNKPVVLDAEGKVAGEVPEKSFFQK